MSSAKHDHSTLSVPVPQNQHQTRDIPTVHARKAEDKDQTEALAK